MDEINLRMRGMPCATKKATLADMSEREENLQRV
jgi:hypothetical protein